MKYCFYLMIFTALLSQERTQSLQVVQFSHSENLSQSSVISIEQDNFDYMWFGTQNGLNKFDGNKIVQFYKNDNKSFSISNNFVNSLMEEDKNHFWIGSNSGVDVYERDHNRIRSIPFDNKQEADTSIVSSIIHNEEKIFLVSNGKLYVYEKDNDFLVELKGITAYLDSIKIRKVISLKNGKMAVISDFSVFEIDHNYQIKKLFDSEYILKDAILYEKYILAVSEKGLFRYSIFEGTIHFSKSNSHNSDNYQTLAVSPENKIFIGTQTGLLIYDLNKDMFSNIDLYLNNIKINDAIMKIFFDKDGSLWLGTTTQGILFYRKRYNNFELYNGFLNTPLARHNNIRSFVRFKNNIIFASLENSFGTLDPISGKLIKNNKYLTKDKLTHTFINTLFNQNNRYLWVGTYRGFSVIDTNNGKVRKVTKFGNKKIENVWKIIPYNDEEYLLGSSNGLFVINKFSLISRSFEFSGIENRFSVLDLKIDDKGMLWIATDKGLIKHNLINKKTIVFKNDPNDVRSISDNYVKTIHIDDNYQLWIGTRSGLDKFYPIINEFKRFTTRDGLPNNVIYGIMEYENHLWVSTNNGLAKIDKETLSIYCYDKTDGLQGVEFNTGAYYQDNGYFYFGGLNGFNRFKPKEIMDLNIYKKPIITDILVNNQSILYQDSKIINKDINLLDEIVLNYDDKIISVEVSLIDYLHLNKRRYQYRMKNFSNDWLNNDSRNLVSFTNLEAGEYIFSVRASTMNLFDSSVQENLKIIIKPPIWNHWLFQVFLALIILAVVYGAHLNRIYHIRRENEILENANKQLMEQIDQRIKAENERKDLEVQLQHAHKLETIGTLAGGIAHDFNNLLTPLIGYSELMKLEFKEDHPYYKMLNNIYSAALRGRDLVQQILVFSREVNIEKKSIRFSQIIDETITLLRPTIPKSVEMNFNCTTEADFIFGSPTQLHQVVMNLCTNALQAIKNETGFIRLNLEDIIDKPAELNPDKDYVKFQISDSGSGIPKDIMDRIFDPFFTTKEVSKGTGLGLSVVHGIIKNHEGKISVESSKKAGTTFTIILPKYNKTSETEIDKTFIREGTEHVIVIDDEDMILDFVEKILTRYGYKVKIFNDSKKGLNYIENHLDEVDILISDQTMPHLTGVQIVQKIREAGSELPIIIMTGFSETVKKDNYHNLGIDALIMKPLTMVHVFEAIEAALKKSQNIAK